jgi:hypothetical protein
MPTRLVRFAVRRACGNSYFDPLAMSSREFGTRSARLHVQVEDQSAAAAMRR